VLCTYGQVAKLQADIASKGNVSQFAKFVQLKSENIALKVTSSILHILILILILILLYFVPTVLFMRRVDISNNTMHN
jgi:hypothetical protein